MRIVIRSEDPRVAREAQAALSAAGIDAAALAGPLRPAPDGEDIVVFPALSGGIDDAAAQAETIMGSIHRPLAALIGLAAASPPPPGLSLREPLLGAIALDAPSKLLAAQVDAYARVAALEEEHARRQSTAAQFGLPVDVATPARKLRALYIGAPSAMFLSLERALAQHGGLVAAAFTSFTGFDHLHDEPFDAVVLNGAEKPQTAISLCAALRRNATLYHLPTMIVVAPGDEATANAAIERGASSVAEANAPCGPSLGWLFEAIRRERRRGAAEHAVQTLRDRMGDPRTGLFLRGPFEAHLANLANAHHGSGRPLALAALKVMPAHGAREPEQHIWRKGFDEIASLAGRLMRETDSGAAVGGDHIAVALPGSDLKGAKRTAERIASVAECTAFAAGDNGAVPVVFEQSAVELQPGESGAALLARALRGLDTESISA